MSTRTIEPIHIVLPDADGGYYRFGELPRLIAEALKPDTEEADADPQGDYYVFRAFDQMDYEKDLPQAAALPPGAPGYLHVVENSASKRPLEWRMGAVLNAGLVHLDWLNEWGESRKPPHVFSTVSAPEPQAATLTKKETVGQRRARYLEWFNEEARTSERGALQRVYEREAKQNPKADRANIGKDIKKARGDANSRKQSGAMYGQLVTVKNGKRQN